MQFITDEAKRSSIAGIDPDVNEELNGSRHMPHRTSEDQGDDPVPPPGDDEEERQEA